MTNYFALLKQWLYSSYGSSSSSSSRNDIATATVTDIIIITMSTNRATITVNKLSHFM